MLTNILEAVVGDEDQATPEVNTRQLRQILVEHRALVIDTRTREQFEAGHIPGARDLNAPANAHVGAIDEFVHGDRAAPLVLYCNGQHCKASGRLATQLTASGFTNVSRYQLGIAVWRALGGPTAIELGGLKRVIERDRTAVLVDARPRHQFAQRSLSGAVNLSADLLASLPSEELPLPADDFNRRIVLFGNDGAQARQLAEAMQARPWHNVAYFPGNFEALEALTG
jgi:rhodanese-related sulfurtransferase